MDKTSIFSKTAKGISALGEKKFALSRDHQILLSMVDGLSSLDILAEKSGLSQETAEQVFARLLADGLVRQLAVTAETNDARLSDDAMISVVELDPEEGVRAWAEAQRASKGLNKEGFYAHKIRPFMGAQGQPSILSVEDDPMLARMLSLLLTIEGFEVRHAANGKGMLDALKESVPDLVILDVMLPDTTGFKLLEWVRRQPKLADLPVIMLTAKVGEEDVLQGLHAGADGYIFKPFTPEPLLKCIRGVLKL